MQLNSRQITSYLLLDNLFINFPIWFPLGYVFLILNFPFLSKYLFISSLFLFAETHFASTWLFFFNRENWIWIGRNLYKLLYLPGYFLFITIFIWSVSPQSILLIHYIASGWHVTKQSTGILKIYDAGAKPYIFLVTLVSTICLVLGLLNPGILNKEFNLSTLNQILLFSALLYSVIISLNISGKLNKIFKDFLPFFTGLTIYVPILFFKDIATATAIGVGMHWCQYLSIVWTTSNRKKRNSKKLFFSSRSIFIFTYSLIMTLLALNGMPRVIEGDMKFSYFYLIPLLFQFYHFYVDGLIWKFSDPHIKKEILPYLYHVNKSK